MRHPRSFPRLTFACAVMIASAVVSLALGLSHTLIVVMLTTGGLVCAAMALWQHANTNAVGDEWWQDDSCSGWRGY